MTAACNWCNANKKVTAALTAGWIGVPAEAVEKSTIIYTTNPTPNWMKGESIFMDMLNRMKKLKGQLKGKSLQEAEPVIYDFRFINAVLEKS